LRCHLQVVWSQSSQIPRDFSCTDLGPNTPRSWLDMSDAEVEWPNITLLTGDGLPEEKIQSFSWVVTDMHSWPANGMHSGLLRKLTAHLIRPRRYIFWPINAT
jgi:hypothetical protein